jgi:hypothetical protein
VLWLVLFNGYQHRLARLNGYPHRLALNSHSPHRPARLSHSPHRPARLGDFPHRLARLTLLPCLSSEKSQNLLSSTDFRQLAVRLRLHAGFCTTFASGFVHLNGQFSILSFLLGTGTIRRFVLRFRPADQGCVICYLFDR